MNSAQMHRVLVSILSTLRYSESARFSDLMRPTGLESDSFKFYLRDLVKRGYVEKLETGSYRLTKRGKEFANSLDEPNRTVQKQPKLSVLIVALKESADGKKLVLMQKRARNPYFGFWSEIHGRAQWGEQFEETAARQLMRQTGLSADFQVRSFRRVRDYHSAEGTLLEDKLFVIVLATNISGELTNSYSGGLNAWMTLEELQSNEKVFPSTLSTIAVANDSPPYTAEDYVYSPEEY